MLQGLERIKKTMAGIPDRVAVCAQMSHHSAKLAGESTIQFYTDAETFLSCELFADEFYGLDAPTTHYDCYNIEAEAMGAKLTWKDNACPETDPTVPLLSSVGDFENLKAVRIGKDGRMPYVIDINKRLMDSGLSPKIRFCGVFSLAAKLLGLENLLMSIISEPEKVHLLMEYLTDNILAPWIICQREQSQTTETATGTEALASPPILTVPMVRDFCLKYIERLEKNIGNIRLAGLWGESFLDNPFDLLDIKRQGYPLMLQALDPDVTALGPALYKQYADKNDMAITMGLDAALIQAGPITEIQTRAQKFIDLAGQDGRFILYINDIPYNTPPEHVHAVVEIAHKHCY